MTTWYLQSHRTWDRLCQSCIGSSFLPRGAFRKGSLCRLAGECTPDRSEALWVTRPKAVASAGSDDQVLVEGRRNILLLIRATGDRLELPLRDRQCRSLYECLAREVPSEGKSLIEKTIEKL